MEFRILGPLQVLDGDTPVEITGAKQQAVLALLILRANEMVGSERLIDELWGEQAPRNATGALYNHVSRLRKALGPDLIARREWGYVLRTPPESIDLRRFESLLAEAEPLPARERAQKLTDALALWHGPPLAGLESEVALQREIARLEEVRVGTIERRIDADLEAGRNSDLVGELEMLIAQHPVREHLRWQLILSLYRAGRQAEALEVYRETRRVLAEQLGLDPSPELRELERAILRQEPTLAVAAAATQPTLPGEEPRRSPRRPLLGGLLGLAVLASGAAAAIALVRSDRPPRTTAGPGTMVIITETASEPRTAPVRNTHHTRPTAHPPAPPPPTSTARPITTTISTASNAPTANVHTTPTARPPTPPRETTTTSPPTSTPRRTTTTTTAATTTVAGPPPKLVTISDTFDGSLLDPTIWWTYVSGTNLTIAQAAGQLQITVGAAAQPGDQGGYISALANTQCTFPGDFDARVDYTLLEWPAGDNVFVGIDTSGAGVGRTSTPSSELYASWAPKDGGTVELPDMSGSLRLARVGNVVSGYIWHKGGWQKFASGKLFGAMALALHALWNPNLRNAPFGRQEVKVAFDNFTVAGTDPVCPAGSQPPSS